VTGFGTPYIYICVCVCVSIYIHIYIFFFWDRAAAPGGVGLPHYRHFTITLRHTTLGKTPLDGWSDRRTDLSLTIHNRYQTQTSFHLAGFEPAILTNERQQQSYAFLRHTTTGLVCVCMFVYAYTYVHTLTHMICPHYAVPIVTLCTTFCMSHCCVLASVFSFFFQGRFPFPSCNILVWANCVIYFLKSDQHRRSWRSQASRNKSIRRTR